MKKLILYSLLSAVVAFGVSPVMPTQQAAAQATASKSGAFNGAGSKTGQGQATLVRNADGSATLTFRNFRVSKGPDLRIWLSNAGSINKSRDVKRGKYVEIAKLKSSKGEQSYRIPAAMLKNGFDQVVIWCKPFGVLFAHAKLG